MLKTALKDVKTFPTYLRWQLERLKKIGTNGGNYKKVRVERPKPEEGLSSKQSDHSDKSDKESAEKI